MNHSAMAFGAILLIYVLLTYGLLPLLWIRYALHHPALDAAPNITVTSDDHPGDPINVALVGTEAQLRQIMQNAGWHVADPLSLRSDLEIAVDTVLKRSFDDAPVSSLYLFGRKEDLAYEQQVGPDPRQRHHVRFWKSAELDDKGRPLWLGSATFDKQVGISHTTGQITHHIAADIDDERDHLFHDLAKTGDLSDDHFVDDFHQQLQGRNGGGDEWHTDGRLRIGTIEINLP